MVTQVSERAPLRGLRLADLSDYVFGPVLYASIDRLLDTELVALPLAHPHDVLFAPGRVAGVDALDRPRAPRPAPHVRWWQSRGWAEDLGLQVHAHALGNGSTAVLPILDRPEPALPLASVVEHNPGVEQLAPPAEEAPAEEVPTRRRSVPGRRMSPPRRTVPRHTPPPRPARHAAPQPTPSGSRRARLTSIRRRRRRSAGLAVAAAFVLVAIATVGVDRSPPEVRPEPAASAPAVAPAVAAGQDTLLLVRYGSQGEPATGATLMTAGPRSRAVVFVPVGLLVDVPGYGSGPLGAAHQYGATALVEASVENALGIQVDAAAAVSDAGLGAWLERSGGLTLDVPDRVIRRAEDGSASVRFEPGEQFLDGERLAEYWAFRGEGETELETFPRQQQVLSALLAQAAADPATIDRLFADGAAQLETSADPGQLRPVLEQLAAASAAAELGFSLLPVVPFGGDEGGAETYRLDEEARGVVAGLMADAGPAGEVEEVRIQVLNGVGRPGIGEEVDRALEGAGFRIELTDNASSFDFTETQILVYAETPELMAAARAVRERLGVGTILVSRQPQSVVDLTIVVGADFVERRAAQSGQ